MVPTPFSNVTPIIVNRRLSSVSFRMDYIAIAIICTNVAKRTALAIGPGNRDKKLTTIRRSDN
ncbi:hypothetical protein [Paenibacillus sp. L3-i20]|uniref:hypothetical protein n=1 Tax=Paenibacillus sp. L3-i20 TaxID=2905833 RepID=UPI001EDF78E2|nr:hypothetical protein [Paenibacillus sp. L3-i20]GKU79411.1 hypothetical protein L3i20_v238080 [Paenibacillus sp. L3-i20]